MRSSIVVGWRLIMRGASNPSGIRSSCFRYLLRYLWVAYGGIVQEASEPDLQHR